VELVEEKLTQERWSPDQISGRLAKDGVAFISHERIHLDGVGMDAHPRIVIGGLNFT
jgi:IS30 family transposase